MRAKRRSNGEVRAERRMLWLLNVIGGLRGFMNAEGLPLRRAGCEGGEWMLEAVPAVLGELSTRSSCYALSNG